MLRRLRLLDRLSQGKLSRREFHQALGLAGLSLAAYPMVSRSPRAADNLVMLNWGGFEDPNLFPEYFAEHGAPDAHFFGDEYEGIAKLNAGFEADIVGPCIDVMPSWLTTGLQPIDESRLIYLDDQFETVRNAAPAFHNGKRYFLSIYWGFTSIIYRTDMTDITPEEESWTLLFDERFAGKMAIWDSTDAVIPSTSLAAGFFDDPFRPDGERLEVVGDMMRKQRDLMRLYFGGVTSAVQAIASGEVVVSYGWSDFLYHLKEAGVPFKWAKPKEGHISYNCGLARSNRQDNEDLQYDFLNAAMSPEAGKFLLEVFSLGASNRKSFDMVDPALLAELEISTPEASLAASHPFVAVPPELKQKHQLLFNDIKAGF